MSTEIERLLEKQEKAKTLYAQLTERIKIQEESLENIVQEMAQLGVTPENIQEKIHALEEKAGRLASEAKKILDGIDI